jgi:phage-related minor tail protein
MERFAKYANEAAKSTGATTLDYTDAALIYYQQGLSESEVKKRTDITIKAANVLGDSADEVSNYLTAI